MSEGFRWLVLQMFWLPSDCPLHQKNSVTEWRPENLDFQVLPSWNTWLQGGWTRLGSSSVSGFARHASVRLQGFYPVLSSSCSSNRTFLSVFGRLQRNWIVCLSTFGCLTLTSASSSHFCILPGFISSHARFFSVFSCNLLSGNSGKIVATVFDVAPFGPFGTNLPPNSVKISVSRFEPSLLCLVAERFYRRFFLGLPLRPSFVVSYLIL